MEKLDEVLGEIPSSEVESLDGVRERKTFVDGNGVGDSISRVKDDSCGPSGGVEGEDSCDNEI